jgi:hypothetical protein
MRANSQSRTTVRVPMVTARKPLAERRAVWRELTWLLALKFIALFLLWSLFFSPSHRSPVDSETTRRRFALDVAAKVAAHDPQPSYEGATRTQKEKIRD